MEVGEKVKAQLKGRAQQWGVEAVYLIPPRLAHPEQ